MSESETKPSLWQSKRKEIIIGATLALLAVGLGAHLLHTYLNDVAPSPKQSATISDIACLDLGRVTEAHGDYEKLKALKAELEELREEEKHLMPMSAPAAPQVDKQPFDDSVWQKNAQEAIGEAAAIMRYKKEITAKYTAETEEEYKAKRDEINARYLNAILNLKLKLDNKKELGYSQETVDEMERLLDELQRERGEYQRQLEEMREREIAAHVDAIIKEKFGDWRAKMEKLKAEQEAAAARAEAEAQSRDVMLMENQAAAMGMMDYLQQLSAKRQEILQKEQEINILEAHIFNDVASRAAKLAILHHFTLVVANPAVRLDYLTPRPNGLGRPTEKYARVVAANATDITEEIIKELSTIKK